MLFVFNLTLHHTFPLPLLHQRWLTLVYILFISKVKTIVCLLHLSTAFFSHSSKWFCRMNETCFAARFLSFFCNLNVGNNDAGAENILTNVNKQVRKALLMAGWMRIFLKRYKIFKCLGSNPTASTSYYHVNISFFVAMDTDMDTYSQPSYSIKFAKKNN